MSTLRFIHAADLHIDSEFESHTPGNAKKRRQGQREILYRLADECAARGAEALLLSGDVFEKDDIPPETRLDFSRALGALAIPVFIAPGNHDPFFSGCIWERMSLPDNVRVFKGEDFECFEHPEINARFWGAGYEKPFCPPLLRTFEAPEKKEGVFDIMLLHGDLSPSDYCPVTRAEIERSGMDYVALGHIHLRSPLELAGKTAFAYPGCTEGRGFDETGEKGAYLITLSESGAEADFVPLFGVKYEIITVDICGGDAADAISRAVGGLGEADYVRLILRGETEEPPDLSALRAGFGGRFAELQLRDESTVKRDIWEQTGQDSLAGLFLQKLKAKLDGAATDEERKKIELAAAYGVAALEGRAVAQ